jgi:hypothetical protein
MTAEVHRMFNAVTLDQDFVSAIWFALFDAGQPEEVKRVLNHVDTDPAPFLPEELLELADRLALKMFDQDCGLSSAFADTGLLDHWIQPITEHRLEEKEE